MDKNNEIVSGDVRLWQVVIDVPPSPVVPVVPDVVVYERQNTRLYRLDGIYRKNDSRGQIFITLGGRGILKIDGEETELTAGKAFIHRHNDEKISYYYPLDGVEPWYFLWVGLDGPGLPAMIDEIVAQHGYVYNVPPDSPIVEKLMSFKCEKMQVRFMPSLLAAETAFSLLHMLWDCAAGASAPGGILVRRVRKKITAEFDTDLSVSAIAEEFNVSREHLSRIFRRETGMTIHDYITRVRMRSAWNMLRDTSLTAKEVAVQCGYSRYSVFFKTFSGFYGCPPTMARLRRK